MLPKGTGGILPARIIQGRKASRTYRMDMDHKRILGYVDDLDAVRQAVYGILCTERYDYLIYSWNYGIELKDLFGRSIPFAKSELKRRITEALMQDDRIIGVDGFVFSHLQGKLSVSFTVHTIYGNFDTGKEMQI